MAEFHDTLILDAKARRLRTGELAASVRCARTGIQDYSGDAVGRPELSRVSVYRPEREVMNKDSMASFAGVPVTIDHPPESVTTDNWKQYAVGETGDEVARDGEFIRVPMLVRDEAAIKAIQDGKRQISMGYTCDLAWEDGVTDDGLPYQAIQRNIKINHLAVVDAARGGPMLKVTDERDGNDPYGDVEYADPGYQSDKKKRYPIDTEEHIRAAWNYVHKKENADKYSSADLAKVKAKIIAAWKAKIDKAGPPSITKDGRTYSDENNPHKNEPASNRLHDGDCHVAKTILIDGYKFDVDDALETAVNKLQAQLKDATDAKTAAETKVGELTAQVSAKDGEIAVLNQKVKDAELNPVQLEKLVADRAQLIGQAKAIDGNIVTDGKTEAEIRKAIVTAKLGDAAKDFDDAAVKGAFAAIVKDVKVDPIRNVMSGGVRTEDTDDARASYEKSVAAAKKNLSDAWKRPAANVA